MATVAGTPVAAAEIRLSQAGAVTTVVSDSVGGFTVTGLPNGTIDFSIDAPGYLRRVSRILLSSSKSNVVLDVISTSPPFSVTYYRQFARNGYEGSFRPLNPWLAPPNFYIRTVADDTGEAIAPSVLQGVIRVIANGVPELSAGRLTAGQIELGEDARPQEPGWVNVSFQRGPIFGAAGLAQGLSTPGPGVGGGFMRIIYWRPGEPTGLSDYGCESHTVDVADHEIVHTMGFYHTPTMTEDFQSGAGCPGTGRPDRVRFHAQIVYSRQPGNIDEDWDPSFSYALALQPASQTPCCREPSRWPIR